MENKEKMVTDLIKIANTLNIIEVKGKQNMDYLLGCINAISELIDVIGKEEEKSKK